jgi:hypothetical protein
MPSIRSISVVFPAPDGPTIAVTSPELIVRDTFLNTDFSASSYEKVMLFKCILGAPSI